MTGKLGCHQVVAPRVSSFYATTQLRARVQQRTEKTTATEVIHLTNDVATAAIHWTNDVATAVIHCTNHLVIVATSRSTGRMT